MNIGRGGWLTVYIQICSLRLTLLGIRLSKHHVGSLNPLLVGILNFTWIPITKLLSSTIANVIVLHVF